MTRRQKFTGPTPAVRDLVLQRDSWRCVCCGLPLNGERGWGWSIHHRRGRDGRPDAHQPQNLISVCGGDNTSGCHGLIHGRRSESEPAGWWLSRVAGVNPLTVPVLVDHGSRFVYLTADGEYSDELPGEAA
ncbi:MAG TPA: hypothetical protein VFR23_04630 [Jiangellaceae bacterium]|nr:hypothetical protein [Jiangellaceae bacterium]